LPPLVADLFFCVKIGKIDTNLPKQICKLGPKYLQRSVLLRCFQGLGNKINQKQNIQAAQIRTTPLFHQQNLHKPMAKSIVFLLKNNVI
jgi:hypothetical protein